MTEDRESNIDLQPEEIRELERFLIDPFRVRIYDDLMEGVHAGLFHPLTFFRTLNHLYTEFYRYLYRPLTVGQLLAGVTAPEEQKYYLLYHLNYLIGEDIRRLRGEAAEKQRKISGLPRAMVRRKMRAASQNKQADQVMLCKEFVQKELDRLPPNNILLQRSYGDEPVRFDFDEVKGHLETISDTKKQIEYLLEVRTEFRQQDAINRVPADFEQHCNLELNKLRQIRGMEESEKQVTPPEAEDEPTKRNPEHTTARQVLAIQCLLQYAKIGKQIDNAEIARFIEFLTGKSYDNIYKKVREPFKDDRKTMLKDLRYIKDWFQRLGITEIAKMVDTQINNRNDFEADE